MLALAFILALQAASPADTTHARTDTLAADTLAAADSLRARRAQRLESVQVSVGCGHPRTSGQGCTGHFAVRHR